MVGLEDWLARVFGLSLAQQMKLLASSLTTGVDQAVGMSTHTQTRLITSLVLIVGLSVFHLLLTRVALERVADLRVRYEAKKASRYATVTIGVLLIGRVWLDGLQDLATFLGLLSAGLAIALRELIVNVAGWVFIMTRRPFQVGDRIQVGSQTGDVIDVQIFQFSLLEVGNWVQADQSTGRIVHVPNARVFTDTVANYGLYVWNEIPVQISFESNWQRAKDLLMEIAARHAQPIVEPAEQRLRELARRFMILYGKLTPTVYTSVSENGVLLTIRYLCEARLRRDSTQLIWEDILRAFEACDDVQIAYRTQRVVNLAPQAPAAPEVIRQADSAEADPLAQSATR